MEIMMAKTEILTSKTAAKQAFLPVLRELVNAYQAFTIYDAANLRHFELTTPQADVLFTLGNTQGMTFKEIGDSTLITKGTLTGVIDRLEEKKLVTRVPAADDRRCMRVVLTKKGEQTFENVFPKHIAHLKIRFDRLNKSELEVIRESLKKIRSLF